MRRICEICNHLYTGKPGECPMCERAEHLFGKDSQRQIVSAMYGYDYTPRPTATTLTP